MDNKDLFNNINYTDNADYDSDYYDGDDLGVTYQPDKTKFRVWAPTADKVCLVIYADDHNPVYQRIIEMERSRNGTWRVELQGNLAGKYYTYKLAIQGKIRETVDPYAVAVGTNSNRGLILNMSRTDPQGWQYDKRIKLENRVDAVIYEIHVRDFSSSQASGIKNRSKYLGFIERETTSTTGLRTGLDHLKELGITHVHLLPIFDFVSVDDTDPSQYNWGYDPYLYNVPEGSYATEPSDGSRIKEFKQMVRVLHDNGIGVIMDVVYNHTYQKEGSPFDLVVPDYYYRLDPSGRCTNGSGCGNEIATEKPMVRKFIIDSVRYWVEEYHIDGFRFDLMALIDRKTVKLVERILHKIDPSILVYGEPWAGGFSALDPELQMAKGAQQGLNVSVFNDHFRNAIKGDNDGIGKGFVSGHKERELAIKKGVVGGIDYSEEIVNFTSSPAESVNYVSSHDNLTLWDKLLKSNGDDSEEIRIRMDRLAQAIVFTSQGISFMAGGEEFLRTKYGNHNSYQAGDRINQLKWERKGIYYSTFKYYQGLIRLRKSHPAFRMTEAEQIRKHLDFFTTPENTVGFILHGNANEDIWQEIVVLYNPGRETLLFTLPGIGEWEIVVNEEKAGIKSLSSFYGYRVKVKPVSAMVLHKKFIDC